MDEKLTLKYDRVGDILYIEKCLPYPEQESEELGDEIIARLNPTTGQIETLQYKHAITTAKRVVSEIVIQGLPQAFYFVAKQTAAGKNGCTLHNLKFS